MYKIYAEIFRGAEHLRHILEEGQAIVNDAFAVETLPGNGVRKEHDRPDKRA